ncbi:hypothetical protein FHS43_005670 [Streptosporangium becharense]|uniref:Uncharacterized protein n=1 Tax=Streptosporangium becharense TaxID=1816182 RepID=A0A7W9ING4_9ACTN|nr:hypothetical protein [Streptosporangium becharense]MBB2914358.1 hypothetical protein [Streptosporangium becharense]MBB5823610.1 hypothetical protein [Streptosporangium becharense]
MDTGQPSADDVYEHYRQLIGDTMLHVHLSWTVMLPDDGAVSPTLQEVGTRLGAGASYELREATSPDVVHLPLCRPGPAWIVDRSDASIVLYGDHPGAVALRLLSAGTRVYSAHWNVNSVNSLSLAIDGEILLMIDGLFPGRPQDHPNLMWWPELTAMSNFFLDYEDSDFLGRDDGWDWQAGFLTAIELATGVRLDRGWLDTERPYLMLSRPIPD